MAKSTPTAGGGSFTTKNPKALECVRQSEYQDKRFGHGKRLHNPTKDGWRCTVCGRETKS